jgi:hypothetical protein
MTKTVELDTAAFVVGIPSHRVVDKLVIKLLDGSEQHFDTCMATVVQFWNDQFCCRRYLNELRAPASEGAMPLDKDRALKRAGVPESELGEMVAI